MIFIITGVHEGTHYKAKFYEASVYKLSSVSWQIYQFFFFVSFCTEYHFYLNYVDRQACANSAGPNQMQQSSK